ncbi:thioredoxin family protein [Clostridium sp. MD294]|uniref:thioredoxin family protein n=1 Tax=Clostridium sp. MD294 TaxID=97138 RepID=UPI0002CAFF4B|nr:thioredoxin family protein [Clostridium sp. MD294]NDO45341.1 thioredoxin family protein [Clostridium sp. MD294]USF31018.1 hypothetical protein C820_002464 [Clostridium sp. MD294]
MPLFVLGKKKKEKECCYSNNYTQETIKHAEKERQFSEVKILGGGCKKCNQLEEATTKALVELGMDSNIEHVKDFEKIASYGVMTTPALVVDDKVVSYGKVLKKEEVIEILKKVRG